MAYKKKYKQHKRIFLNPAEKGKKYSKELKTDTCYTNAGQIKKDKNGRKKKLSKKQRAYRCGYLDSRKDNANAYISKRKTYSTKKSKKKKNEVYLGDIYNDFDWTENGHIKGSYTVDGFFEPD